VLSLVDFRELVVKHGNALAASGLVEGDAVLIATGRGNDFWIDVFAAWRLGLVAVPIEASSDPETLRTIATKTGARGVLCAADQNAVLAGLGLAFVERRYVDSMPEAGPADLPAGAPAMILFTSGSTGQPKGALLSHDAILGNALSTRERIGLRAGDRLLFVIPFRFVSALSHVLVGLLAGAEIYGFEKTLIQSEFCRLLAQHACTAYGGSPLQARWIAEYIEQGEPAEKAFPHLRWLMSSGDYLQEELAQRLVGRGLDVIIAYGLTEVAGRFCIRHVNREDRPDTAGRPIEGLTVSFAPESLSDPIRILSVSGRFLFDGYVGDPKQADSASDERFFLTGDVGEINSDGSVSLNGRADDVFKVAGNKVSCLSIAAALLQIETIKEAAVLARPYPMLGMAPHALIVLRPGMEFDKGKILRHIRSALGSYHLPRAITVVAKIPRTGSGKVDRRALIGMVETMQGG
jgi:acyl-coenzyme A synthetase/AMP-(fatty) acid ligase